MARNSLPIVLSVLSFVLAAFALGWNIYRDVVLKPRAKISVAKAMIVSEFSERQDKLIISAVNFGPGKIRLNIIRFMQRSFFQRIFRNGKFGALIHDYRNPISGQLPIALEVGEKVDLIFPWDKELICSKAPTHIGIQDSFGRIHWAPKDQVAKANKQWVADWSEHP